MEADKLPGFRLTARDAAIIQAVYEYRAMTSQQVAALFFATESGEEVNTRCKQRLRMLYQYGYIFRDEQPSKLSEGRKPLIYMLDTQGAAFLAQTTADKVAWRQGDNDVSSPFLEHLLATNWVRIALILSAREHGWNLLKWLDDRTLKSPQMKGKVVLKGERGGRLQAAVIPDAYIRLDATEDIYNFFLEMDRGTVTGEATEWGRRDWRRKIKAYLEYYRSGLYQKRYHTSDMRVVTVTTSEARLAHLKTITEEAGGKARFWFTTFERIKAADILTDPIWMVASRENRSALITTNSTTVFEYKPTPDKPSS